MKRQLVAVTLMIGVSLAELPPLPPDIAHRQSPTANRSAVSQGDGARALVARAAPVVLRTNTLVWEYPEWGAVTNFMRYSGRASRVYTNAMLVGRVLTNQLVTVRGVVTFAAVTALDTNGLESDYSAEVRIPAAPLTNLVLTVTSEMGLESAPAPGGPWRAMGQTNCCLTNPMGAMFYRGCGGSNRVGLAATRF